MVQAHHVHSTTPKPSPGWGSLSDEERLRLVRRVAKTYMRIRVMAVRGIEVLVQPPPRAVGYGGSQLRCLEVWLRQHVGEPLEVYCETQRDQNKPRHPDQRRKIQAWVEARQAIKIQRRGAQ